ncbi:MAG TPA: HD domain-containing phosphohydrolase [Burkholderiales bacterium]|nr:HD domain-containing phosphohydrolase [Burkholderiales bacterium]
MKIKKTIDELKPGMFVLELDRPWLDTPFPLQGFLVQSPEDIETLREYCEYVFIDPLREQIGANTARLRAGPLASLATGKDARVPLGVQSYPIERSVEEELPSAKVAYDSAIETLTQIRNSIERGRALDAEAVSRLVEGLVGTIVSNPDALMLILRMRKEAQPAYVQAMSVAAHMLAFGRHLGLPIPELALLGMAGLLLDVGKLRLPRELVDKKQLLSRAEYALMKRHVQYGEDILRQTKGTPERVVEIVAQHHERENGSGYPRGLRGTELTVYGRMAGIVDCYRELTFGGPAGTAVSPYEAMEVIHGWGGKFLHPVLVEQFTQCIGIYPVGSLVELNTGEVAIVVAHNRAYRLRPRLMIILDPHKREYPAPKSVDLMHAPIADAGVPYEIKRALEPGMFGIEPRDYYL